MSTDFQVGDRVVIPLGKSRITGVISEDRGAIGFHGRHLYQVLVSMDPLESTTFEIPEDEIEPLGESGWPEAEMDKDKIQRYLINGGLIAILRSNLSGGRNHARVWLRPDSLGNVTHTFDQEWGVIGGETVPFSAIHDGKIFTPKRNEVLLFLQSFDLEHHAAEKVLSAIGTAP